MKSFHDIISISNDTYSKSKSRLCKLKNCLVCHFVKQLLMTLSFIGVAAFLITLLLGLTFSMMTIGDGPFPIDPLLFHPIVRSLCCCQNFLESAETRDGKNGEDVAKMLNK